MQIEGSTALVTGANRGIGREFVAQLLDRGARGVYAATRRPDGLEIPGADVLALDITDPAQVMDVAKRAADVDLLVNNAGTSLSAPLLGGDMTDIRLEMETHYFGTLGVIRAFAPVLAANGGGAILDMLSALSWLQYPAAGAYSAAKAAAWSMTDAVRLELAAQGTLVTALHVGAVDTDMMADMDVPKSAPARVVASGLDGIEAGATEVIADEATAGVKASLTGAPEQRYAELAGR